MKKLRRVILIVLSIFLMLNTSIYADEVSEAISPSINTEDIYIDNGILMNGILNYYDLSFQIDKNMNLQSSYLNLDFNVSPIGEYPYSSMVVYLNNSPIGTYNLYDLRGTNHTIKIELNKELLIEGNNVIRIGTFNRITKEQCCLDEVNIANWVNLNNTTYIHLEYLEEIENYSISDFPYPFMRRYNKQKFSVVIDDALNKQESDSAINFISSMAKQKNSNIGEYDIITKKKLDEKVENDLVFIMNYKELPDNIKELITEEEKARMDDSAIVKIVSSPYKQGKGVMIISSFNNEYLNEAALLLGEKEYIKKISSNTIFVNKYEKPSHTKLNNKITFADLGYGTSIIQGIKNSGMKYYYKYPIDKEAIGGELRLYLKYSPNIDFNNAKIGVKANGNFLTEKLLKDQDESLGYIDIPISEEVLQGQKAIDLELIININSFSECISKEDENIWVQIENSSYIELQYKDRKNITLDSYAAAFIKDKSIEDLEIIIPKGIQYINLASKVAEYIGLETMSGENISLIYDNEISSTEKNAIIIGLPEKSPLIKSLNKSSHINFNEDYTSYLNNGDLGILEGSSGEISTLEILKSPWNKKKDIIIFKSLNVENLKRDIKYLSNTSYIYPSKGTEMAIGKEHITTFTNEEQLNKENDFMNKIRGLLIGNRKYILMIFGATLIVILSALFIMYRKINKEK